MSSNSKIVITRNRQMGYTCCGPENWRRMESSNLFSLTSMINDYFFLLVPWLELELELEPLASFIVHFLLL